MEMNDYEECLYDTLNDLAGEYLPMNGSKSQTDDAINKMIEKLKEYKKFLDEKVTDAEP